MTQRLWLANLHAGSVIGKGGSHIKNIREGSGCRVTIAEALMPHADRLVTITGSPSAINRAVELILTRLEEDAQRQPAALHTGPAIGDPTGAGSGPPPLPAMNHVLKLCCSNHQTGALIGKGGTQVKAFREGSGANIKVDTTIDAYTNDRLVSVMGVKDQVVRAHLLIVQKLATLPTDDSAARQPAAKVGHAHCLPPSTTICEHAAHPPSHKRTRVPHLTFVFR